MGGIQVPATTPGTMAAGQMEDKGVPLRAGMKGDKCQVTSGESQVVSRSLASVSRQKPGLSSRQRCAVELVGGGCWADQSLPGPEVPQATWGVVRA